MTDVNRLIYGKHEQQRIVSIEVTDDQLEMFIQEENGAITSKFENQKFWLLSNKQLDKNFIRLKGDLHYKWGRQFNSRESWSKVKFMYNKEDIYCIYDAKEMAMCNKGISYFKGLKPKEVSILSFDIETTGFSGAADKLLLISNTYRNSAGVVSRQLFAYDEYESEKEMLEDWCNWVINQDPSIIAGHNIYGFDLPFLQEVADREGTTLALGRNGSDITFAQKDSQKRKDGSQSISYKRVRCYGRELIDTMFLAITYDVGRKYESYGLKKIIEHEGIRFEGRVMYDAGLIKDNYQDPVEWEKIKKYCIYDSDEALQLYDLMIPSIFYMTQSVPKSFQSMIESATGAQINSVMVRSYLQEAHSLPKQSEAVDFEGAISLGNPGIYSNVYKVDVASLYPSIMLQYEVYDAAKDPQANFSKILQTFTTERLKNKKLAKDTGDKYYDDLQGAYKIFINSMYGFMGATGLLFNSPKNAAFITQKGREILTTALEWAKGRGYKIINADTDSISYAMSDESDMSEETRANDLDALNSLYPEKIHFEDDGYFKKVIILRAKNYVLYDGKKIKYKGSALKSSKMEIACKDFQQEIIKTIIDDKFDYQNIYARYVKEACNVKDIKRWSSKKTYTKKIDDSERSNETKIKDAIEGSNYKEGDKFWTFFLEDGSLRLAENFDGNYDKLKMCEKIYKSAQVFSDIIAVDDIFINYKLKKNQKTLDTLIKS
jgi:DNA polymerase, archaea type